MGLPLSLFNTEEKCLKVQMFDQALPGWKVGKPSRYSARGGLRFPCSIDRSAVRGKRHIYCRWRRRRSEERGRESREREGEREREREREIEGAA